MTTHRRWPAYAVLVLLYALHNDVWLWDDARFLLGLPVGLTYHVVFNLVVTLVMLGLVRWAWPDELEMADDQDRHG